MYIEKDNAAVRFSMVVALNLVPRLLTNLKKGQSLALPLEKRPTQKELI